MSIFRNRVAANGELVNEQVDHRWEDSNQWPSDWNAVDKFRKAQDGSISAGLSYGNFLFGIWALNMAVSNLQL